MISSSTRRKGLANVFCTFQDRDELIIHEPHSELTIATIGTYLKREKSRKRTHSIKQRRERERARIDDNQRENENVQFVKRHLVYRCWFAGEQ